jgi:hypothetical protein
MYKMEDINMNMYVWIRIFAAKLNLTAKYNRNMIYHFFFPPAAATLAFWIPLTLLTLPLISFLCFLVFAGLAKSPS